MMMVYGNQNMYCKTNESVTAHGMKTSETKTVKYHITRTLSHLNFQMYIKTSHLAK